MRPILFFLLSAVAACLALPIPAAASKPDPDNFPLRVHVFKNTQKSRHTRQNKGDPEGPEYLDGMGVADLFENGVPRGLQFSFSCVDGLQASGGYGTYPARWKKRDKTLEVLVPQKGKPWNMETCDLQTEMRPGLVFYWRNGAIAEEAGTVLKAWMTKHQYDPEKGKDDPVMAVGETVAPGDSDDPQIAEPD